MLWSSAERGYGVCLYFCFELFVQCKTQTYLFSSLHRHSKARLSFTVDCHSDNAARHLSRILVGCAQETSVRSTKTHRHAESLSRANGDVTTPRRRRSELCQCHQISGTVWCEVEWATYLDGGRKVGTYQITMAPPACARFVKSS